MITSKGQIVIPASVRQKEGFKSGQKVAVLAFDDRVELRPMGEVLSKVDFVAERERIGKALKDFVDKNGLRGMKIRELTVEDKDELAREYYSEIRRAKNKV